MKNLLLPLSRLSRRKKVMIGALLLAIMLTWLAVCLVLASILLR
jgi:hypothetical protein